MPKLLKTPFAAEAAEGFRTDIQESTGAAPNSATYQVGFPPNTMQSIASSGMPPKGSDLNGVLYDITDNLVFLTQGGGYGFDSAYATSIGGYPLGARLRLTNGDIVKSTIDGNANDPNENKNGWTSDTGLTSTPEWFGAKGDGVTTDNAAFSALAATNPTTVELDPDATYLINDSSTITFSDECVINGHGATIIMDQRWNIQKTPMWGSQLSADVAKGQTVLPMQFMTNFTVGAEILVFHNKGLSGAAIDPYFASVQDDEKNGDEIEAHVELAARVLERGEAAFIFGQLFRIRVVRAGQPRHRHRRDHEQDRKSESHEHE